MTTESHASALIRQSGVSTIGSLFRARARLGPDAIAVDDGQRRLTYAALNERVNRAAHALATLGVGRGERVAVLSENRIEYLELELAAAKLGAIAACQNWRLAPPELQHCVSLVEPRVVMVDKDGIIQVVHTGYLSEELLADYLRLVGVE